MQELFKQKIIKFVLENPKRCILFSLLFCLSLSAGLVNIETDFGVKNWFRSDDPLIIKLEQFEKQFGSDESAVFAIHNPKGVFNPETIQIIKEVTEKMWLVPEVIRVDSLSNFHFAKSTMDDIEIEALFPEGAQLDSRFLVERKKIALSHKVIPGFLVNKAANIALVFARMKPTFKGESDYVAIAKGARKIQREYQKKFPDINFYLTGGPIINFQFLEVMEADLAVFMPAMTFLLLFFLFLSFRSVLGIFLPFIIIGSSIAMCFGLSGWLDIKLNNLVSSLPGILVAISIADTVHILVTYFQALGSGKNRKEATRESITKNLWPTFLTSFTTSLGFLSLMTSPLTPISNLGLLASLGTLFAWVLTIFLIIPLLLMLPIKGSASNSRRWDGRYVDKFIFYLSKYTKSIILGFVALTIGFFYLGSLGEVNSDPFSYFSKRVPVRKANRFLKDNLGGNTGPEIYLDTGVSEGAMDPELLQKVEKLQLWLEEIPFVNRTLSIIQTIKEMNQHLHGGDASFYRLPKDRKKIAQEIFLYNLGLPQGMGLTDRVTIDKSGLRVSVLWKFQESKISLEYMDKIKSKISELGLNGYITGKIPLYKEMNGHIVETFVTSIGMAILLVSIVMLLIFRSIPMAMISMLPNVIPLIFGGGFLWLIGKDFDVGCSIVASVALGIAVDDTIHFLVNYVEKTKAGMSPTNAIKEVLTNTGPALVWTTIILIFGFGCFIFGDFMPNFYFGILSSFVLGSALLIDLVFLPAILIWTEKISESKMLKPAK